MTALPLLIILLITIVTTGLPPSLQQPSSQEPDETAINELYAQWSRAARAPAQRFVGRLE